MVRYVKTGIAMNEQSTMSEPPASVGALLERLDSEAAGLSPRLQQCAQFTRRHLHLIAVSTVSEMARSCDVAPSVYMRFCQAIGFSGYSEMQALLKARFTDYRPDYDERMASLRKGGLLETGRLLADFAEAGHRSLLSLSNQSTNGRMERMARGMAEARVIHLVGLRRAFSIVSNMAYTFNQLGVPATLHYGAGMISSGRAIFDDDALFAVTYAPFSPETVALAQDAAQRGIAIYGLTDSSQCPFAEAATEMLYVREDEVGGFRALTASMALATALAVAVKAIRDPA